MAAWFYNQWDEEEKGFGITLLISIFLHGIVFLTVIVLFSNSTSYTVLKSPVYTVEFFDTVPQKPPAAAPPGAKSVTEEKAIVLKKSEEKREAALEETIQKLKRETRERDIQKGIEKAKEELITKRIAQLEADIKKREKAARPVMAVPSKGMSETSESAGTELMSSYINNISDKIQSAWVYPGSAGEALRAIMVITIDRKGNVLEKRFERKSGNPIFDQSVLKAIDKASPLPPFPDVVKDKSMEVGIRFCPYCP